jgi:uncharacterized Tic20 family protein
MPDEHPIPTAGPATPTEQERTWAMLTHLLAGVLVLATPVPGVVFAIVMWLLKKDESAYLDDHGREATNFWVSVLIYSLVIGVIAFITCGFGALLYIPLLVLAIVGVIQATLAAKRGEYYRYPATLRLF